MFGGRGHGDAFTLGCLGDIAHRRRRSFHLFGRTRYHRENFGYRIAEAGSQRVNAILPGRPIGIFGLLTFTLFFLALVLLVFAFFLQTLAFFRGLHFFRFKADFLDRVVLEHLD